MERGQLYRVGVLRAHFKQDFLKGVELTTIGIHVILVHLMDK